jgi:ribonuclease BN (tRNA processing enzyme)
MAKTGLRRFCYHLDMKLTVLGSGTSVPHPHRSSSGFWLETTGGTILLDCSPSAIHRMAEEGCDWAGLDAIWISHFHLDHFGGLAPFLFSIRYAPQTEGRSKPLRIFGPKGIKDLLTRFDDANNYRLFEQRFPLEIVEVNTLQPFEIARGVEAVAAKTPHTDESHAIHLRDGETTLVFTSDTGFHEPLSAFARHVDLFILECSFVQNKPVETHLELAEAIYLIRKAEPKQAMLTHLYPEWDEVELKHEVSKIDPNCEVIEAVDGLKLDLTARP